MRASILLLAITVMAGCTSGGLQRVDVQGSCGDSAPQLVLRKESLSFLTLNASHGRNSSFNQMMVSTKQTYENLDKIARVLNAADADVVALQEADGESLWSGSFSHVEYLRENTRLNCSLLGRHSDSWLASYGTALLSRASLKESASIKFPATPPTTTKGFVVSEIYWDAGAGAVPVTVVSVHLDFSRKYIRDRQVAILIETLRDIETPIVLMGDMNSDWDQKRSHVQQLADGLDLIVYDPESETLGTYKGAAGKRLDWILVSRDLQFAEYRVLPDKLSDHLAVYAQIRVRPAEALGE